MVKSVVIRVVRFGALLGGLWGAPACKEAPKAPAPPGPARTAPAPAAFAADAEVVLVLSDHDGLSSAREQLEAALRLPAELPLPFPRVEHHGDRYRVTLGRGKYQALRALAEAVPGAKLVPAAEAMSDEVVRLGIVCTEPGGAAPLVSADKQRAKLDGAAHGRVLLLAEEDDPEAPSQDADQGYLRVTGPAPYTERPGLVRAVDVLLPADCTPRDEDNDDGNGRLLAGGRLCLTTRVERKDGELSRAALLAVARSYRRCTRFPGAGTFDGFDHNDAGTQFAVEVGERLDVFDVTPAGELRPRAQLPELQRPAYLQGALLAVREGGAEQSLFLVPAAALAGAGPLAPQRIFTMAGARFVARKPAYRAAAPVLRQGRVVVSFQQPCAAAEERRVQKAARREFGQCLREVEVEVGMAGEAPRRRCQLNNTPTALEQPIALEECP